MHVRKTNDVSALVAISVALALILEGHFFTQSLNTKEEQIQTLKQQLIQSDSRFQGFVEGRKFKAGMQRLSSLIERFGDAA